MIDACSIQLVQFVGNALPAERTAIVVATESPRNSLLFRLPGIRPFEEIAVALSAEITEYDWVCLLLETPTNSMALRRTCQN